MAQVALVFLGIVAEDHPAALGTDLFGGRIPGHEVAVGIVLAAVIIIAALGFLFQQARAALGTGHAGVLGDGLGVFARGIARAGQEFPEAAGFDDHASAAQLAHFVGLLIGDLDALFVQIDLGLGQFGGKLPVKAVQDLPVVLLAGFHQVQFALHGGGELHVHDVPELVDHQVGDRFAQIGGTQGAALLGDIFPVQDDGDCGGVGAGPAHALFLHGLDERRLGVPGGGLGKVLPGLHLLEGRPVAGLQPGQGRFLLGGGVVGALLIQGQKAGKRHALSCGAEDPAAAADVRGHGVQHGVGHLAGDEPGPDQLVQPVLVGGEAFFQAFRLQGGIGGADSLVGVLGILFGVEGAGFCRLVFPAELAGDIAAGGSQRLVGDAQRVGTHIGDQTGQAHALQFHALVQLLGHRHGALGGHAQLAGGLLLEGGRGEGGRGLALFPGVFHGLYFIGPAVDGLQHLPHAAFIGQLLLALFIAEEMGGKIPLLLAEGHVDAPVFLGDEGADLPLPVHHHAGDHALNAAGGEAGAHLPPQEGAELVAHDAVQDPAGLLGVHQVHVDVPGVPDGLGDGGLGDLVEGDPLGLVTVQLQKLLQMPGNGLALPVRVGCQIDKIGLVRCRLQLTDNFILALDGHIGGLKMIVHIHAQFLFGQVAEMAHGSLHLIAVSQIFGDGLGLGGRLHDQKFCHVVPPFTIRPRKRS